jgi:hypothetical protein
MILFNKEKPRNFKRMVVMADLHGGHRVGLTPPKYWSAIPGEKYYKVQQECWGYFTEMIDVLKPIDIVVVNGDATEGKAKKSGGNELITTDRFKQAKIAATAIDYCGAKKIRLMRGTPYHTGAGEDFENAVQLELGLPENAIEDHAWFDINGVIFSIRHFVGSSTIPHGRFTALARAKLWNTIWHNEQELQPDARFIIRSHVHYCVGCYEADTWEAFTTPALQAAATKFGALKCEGLVHWGFVYFDIFDDGSVRREFCTKPITGTKIIPTKL